MLEGLYSAAAGMEAQQVQLEALANDLANVDTPGYQSARVGFHDLLYTSSGDGAPATGAGSAAEVIGRSGLQGSIQATGQPLDVALVGPGYIEVRRPDGTIGLTRNGVLQINSQGEVTTSTGLPLQPPIRLPNGVTPSQVKIAADGTVSAGGRTLGRISIVNVPAPDQLLAVGDGVFTPTTASGAVRAANGTVIQQGAIESSNVDMAQAMTTMLDAQQSYAMASKAIQFQDQMLQIANQVKR